MTLILTNEEIESIFTLEECFNALEPALRDLGNGQAVNMPRQDLLVPGPLENSYHGLKDFLRRAAECRRHDDAANLRRDHLADNRRQATSGESSIGHGQ